LDWAKHYGRANFMVDNMFPGVARSAERKGSKYVSPFPNWQEVKGGEIAESGLCQGKLGCQGLMLSTHWLNDFAYPSRVVPQPKSGRWQPV
jgi:hypothetical protein